MRFSFIGRFIVFCARHAWAVVIVFFVLSGIGIYAGMTRLDVTTDTSKMLSPTLPWKQRSDEMGRLFPQKENLLIAVVDADLPEVGEETARQLAHVLSADHKDFEFVHQPDASPYLVRNGLMFLEVPALSKVLDDTITAQPFLASLAQDPSARGLFKALSLIAKGVDQGQDISAFNAPLIGFANALEKSADGHGYFVSWERLLGGKLTDLGGRYRFVVTKPKLDYGSFQPGGAAAAAMRQAISTLPFVRTGHAKVYITGQVQIDDEEFATVAEGMVAGLIGSLVLVTLWLTLAVKTWRVIFPIVVTLVVGLLLTTGFAAFAVGTLNLISVAFAVLFVGIAVDFAIQFSVRFRAQELPFSQENIFKSLQRTGDATGKQILVAALATSAGFLAFTPTAFLGVAQLGLIAGVGMIIAFICTASLLPALLRLCHATFNCPDMGFSFMRPVDIWVRTYRKWILLFFGVLALSGVILIPFLRFDGDPLHTKNPNSEGMRTLMKLINNPQTSPYSAELLTPSLTDAKKAAQRFSVLPDVSDVMWLGSFVPTQQQEKLAIIQDAATMLLPTLMVYKPALPPPNVVQLRASAKASATALGRVLNKLPKQSPLRRIQQALLRLSQAQDTVLLAANTDLVKFLPMELNRLRLMLQAQPVTMKDVPPVLANDYLLPDGRALVEVYPKGVIKNSDSLDAFVTSLQKIAPTVAGSAVDIVESAHSIVLAFEQAVAAAVIMIAVILFLMLRRILDMSLVLAPLLLSALMTIILIVVIPETLNFANIISLPLLLGVGVSFNIYFVMNWRDGLRYPLASPTARAVLFSALTTGTAFGSLALSHHPGTASMGRLLLLSLGCTLVATLAFVPALLPKTPQAPQAKDSSQDSP